MDHVTLFPSSAGDERKMFWEDPVPGEQKLQFHQIFVHSCLFLSLSQLILAAFGRAALGLTSPAQLMTMERSLRASIFMKT